MPTITTDELGQLRGLVGDIDATTIELRKRCDAKALCDNLKKHTDALFVILNDVNGRQN